jgi:hypothetical protein
VEFPQTRGDVVWAKQSTAAEGLHKLPPSPRTVANSDEWIPQVDHKVLPLLAFNGAAQNN